MPVTRITTSGLRCDQCGIPVLRPQRLQVGADEKVFCSWGCRSVYQVRMASGEMNVGRKTSRNELDRDDLLED